MTDSLRRLNRALLAALALVALALGYWGLVRRESLLARNDNPRRVLEEQRIQRGQILDRHGVPLTAAEVEPESRVVTRRYLYPSAAPVVGYYSLQYGVGGIEAAYDDLLRGNTALTPGERLLNQWLHRSQAGGEVRLTIDVGVQQAVQAALASHSGAAVVLTVPDGDILAIGSQPTFDPNTLEENWESLAADDAAPLLNRATQGLYQPGTALQSVVLGAALNSGLLDPSQPWQGDLSVTLSGGVLPCAGAAVDVDTIARAYLQACPAPFQAIGRQLNARRLSAALTDFGLLDAPAFALPTAAADLPTPLEETDAALTAIGQSELTVSPLQMAMVAGALADQGRVPALRLVEATRTPGGGWQPEAPAGNPRGTISPESIEEVDSLMRRAVANGTARGAALPDQVVYGHTGLALSGPEGNLNAWFIGFVRLDSGRSIAAAVLIEDAQDANTAAQIGGQVLQAALQAVHFSG
jgi:peptidoglycan glycosyltransferase